MRTRRDATLVLPREHRVANLAVMRMGLFERPVVERCLLRAPGTSLLAQTKEIRRRAIEVALAAVDDAMLEQSGRVPGREFFRPQVRDFAADLVPRLLLAQREIQLDAVHALGFELEVAALVRREYVAGHSAVDGGSRCFEFSGVDVRDDIVEQQRIAFGLRGAAGRARHAEQQRRQQ